MQSCQICIRGVICNTSNVIVHGIGERIGASLRHVGCDTVRRLDGSHISAGPVFEVGIEWCTQVNRGSLVPILDHNPHGLRVRSEI